MLYKILYKFYYFALVDDSPSNIWNRILIRIFNYLLPLYFTYRINKKVLNNNGDKYIVSLTTFADRINDVYLVIETLLSQTVLPNKIILWLSYQDFQNENKLPRKLRSLKNRGLEIKFIEENLMPHKKYFYSFQEYPNSNIITVDDDMFYDPTLIEKLIHYHKKFPYSIICPITREISISEQKQLDNYSSWKNIKSFTVPTKKLLTMGGGGTLFPPLSLHDDCFNKDRIIKYALKADDLWLKIMSVKANTTVVSIAHEFPQFPIPIINNSSKKLMDQNVTNGGNDEVFQTLMETYGIEVTDFID